VAIAQDEIKKEKSINLSIFFLAIEQEWKSLPQELAIKLAHSMNNRISVYN
jgi:hypothetical protein